jgi:hypothetical protein
MTKYDTKKYNRFFTMAKKLKLGKLIVTDKERLLRGT